WRQRVALHIASPRWKRHPMPSRTYVRSTTSVKWCGRTRPSPADEPPHPAQPARPQLQPLPLADGCGVGPRLVGLPRDIDSPALHEPAQMTRQLVLLPSAGRPEDDAAVPHRRLDDLAGVGEERVLL